MSDLERARQRQLLDEVRRLGGRISTGQAHAFYQTAGWGSCRTTARRDLRYYARRGVLTERGGADNRFYTLNGDHA